MAREGFGTDPTGRLARGFPSGSTPRPTFGIGVGSGTLSPGLSSGNPVVKFKTSFKKGGSVSSASKRADGCAIKGKTKGKMV